MPMAFVTRLKIASVETLICPSPVRRATPNSSGRGDAMIIPEKMYKR